MVFMELHLARRSGLGEPEGFVHAAEPGRSQVVSLPGCVDKGRARAEVERVLHAPNRDPAGQGRGMLGP